MAPRKGYLHSLAQAQKAHERHIKAQQRAATQAAREAERARLAYQRSQTQTATQAAREQKAYEKEQAQLYLESRIAEVALENEQLEDTIDQLNNIMGATLDVDDFFDVMTLKQKPELPVFDARAYGTAGTTPTIESYLPAEPSGLKRFCRAPMISMLRQLPRRARATRAISRHTTRNKPSGKCA
jgi:restriction system protein